VWKSRSSPGKRLIPDLSPILYLLIGWVLLLAIVVGFAVLASLRRPGRVDGFPGNLRIGAPDRRTAARDRRVGLADHREVRVERRRASADRRGAPRDRRRSGPSTA
jgi:hypothetical protein